VPLATTPFASGAISPAWLPREASPTQGSTRSVAVNLTKPRRAIATRYDKTAVCYAAGIAIAASLDWIKSVI
jgi:hypothetical protein